MVMHVCVLELILGVLHEGVFVELSFAWGFWLVFVDCIDIGKNVSFLIHLNFLVSVAV